MEVTVGKKRAVRKVYVKIFGWKDDKGIKLLIKKLSLTKVRTSTANILDGKVKNLLRDEIKSVVLNV